MKKGSTYKQRRKTISIRNMQRVQMLPVVYPDVERPRTRGDCIDGPRPCPFVSCRYHLAIEVSDNGSISMPHGHVDIERLEYTCTLDLADGGPIAQGKVSRAVAVSRERINQIEGEAMRKLRSRPRAVELAKAI